MSRSRNTGRSSGRPSLWRRARLAALLGVGVVVLGATAGWDPASETPERPPADLAVTPPVALPVEVNERVMAWMRRFQTDQRASFERFLTRETVYSALIRGKLRERGMPEELLYLAMIESGFTPGATSPVAAVGMWQFMGPTARQYGLRVDAWVDERRDPVSATDAALDYLEWLHRRYGSWYLAAAAYNAGPGRVDQALRRYAGGRKGDEDLYWEIIDHLPRETRAYVPKMLAATMLARRADAYGFSVKREGPYRFDRVWVPGGTTLRRVAKALDVPVTLMRDLNPHLVRGVTPPGAPFALRIPVGTASGVVAALGGGRSFQADD
ncbi:MAG TPA: lytic transglycosylase domain-containing protein [Longimicrobiales bacterium]|nr:lytic transglycosylase domain-containing protein [Longimicrobiales bacterium]